MKKQMLAALTAILLVSCGSETTETPSSVSLQTASIEETVILDQNGLKITKCARKAHSFRDGMKAPLN